MTMTASAIDELLELARSLGVEWDGARWTGLDDDTREALRREALRLGLRPEEPDPEEDETVHDLLDPEFLERIEARERQLLTRARERTNDRFIRAIRRPEVRSLALDNPAEVAELIALEAPVTAETVSWAASHPALDVELGGVPAHVDPRLVKAAGAVALASAKPAVLAIRRDHLLAGGSFDITAAAARTGLTPEQVERIASSLPAEVQIRAEIKRRLVALWRGRSAGQFPDEPKGDRWARIAWLAMVALAVPPVFADKRRWDARKALGDELAGLTLTVSQLAATVQTARKATEAERARTA